MKIEFHIRGFQASTRLRRWLEQPLNRLRGLVTVTTADVVIERQREIAPAFRAFVHLAVPGPDIHAEAREHTLEAVWLKVIGALRRQVAARNNRRKAQVKDKRHTPLLTGRWRASAAGIRP
jgi:ribosome-associated translation inhibitor RaiA